MTFAQELRHAVSVEPILDSTPPPAQPFGGSDEDWIAYDITYKERSWSHKSSRGMGRIRRIPCYLRTKGHL